MKTQLIRNILSATVISASLFATLCAGPASASAASYTEFSSTASTKDKSAPPEKSASAGITPADITAVRKISDPVMAKISEEDIQGAFDLLGKSFLISKTELNAVIRQIVSQREVAVPVYGDFVETELVRQETLGNSLIQLTYLEKREKHLFVWFFTFYRARNKWTVNNFTYNDKPQELFPGFVAPSSR